MFASVHPSRIGRSLLLAALGAAVVGVLALAPAAGASAHDYLVQSSPAANSTQTTPLKTVSLTFNDRVLDLSGDGSSALVQVIGPDEKHFETGCPSILDRTVSAPVALGAAGAYEVTWQIVSADGHTVSSSFGFSYAPPAGTTPAEGRVNRPTCGDGTSSSTGVSTATSAPTTSPASGGDGLGLVIGIGVGIAVLAIAGVVVVLATARRSTRGSSESPPADD